MRQLDEAEGICRRALVRYGASIDIFATQTLISFINRDWIGIIDNGSRYRESLERYRNHQAGSDMVEVATYSEEWKILCWMGMAMLNLGDADGAEDLFARALKMTTDKAFVSRQAANSLSEAGYHERARRYMEESQSLPNDLQKRQAPSIAAQRGVQRQSAEPEAVLVVDRKGLRIADNHAEKYFSKGVALEKTGRLGEAAAAYRETIRRNNSHVGAYNNLAGILLRNKEDHEALMILQTASDKAMNHYALSYSLGLVHSVIGNHEEALKQFDKSLELFPGLKKANIQKALIFLKRNDFDNAIECLNKEIENRGDVVPALITLGEINLHLNNHAQALHHFQKVTSLEPENAAAKRHIEFIQRQS
jgi:tetratricopeptide (TPR) repeat protein